MKIKLETTGTIEMISGVRARLWVGFTEGGIPIKAYINLLEPQTHDPAMLEDFEKELKFIPAERQLAYFDIRLAT